MKRKTYATPRERKADQIKGFVAFPIVNIIVAFATNQLLAWAATTYRDLPRDYLQARNTIELLPWVVNGIVLAWAFLFRPEIGIGYIGFIGSAVVTVTALSFLFLAACFTTIGVGLVFSRPTNGPNNLGTALALLLFFGLMLAGLIWLGQKALAFIAHWWSSGEEASPGIESAKDRSEPSPSTERDGGG